MRVATGHRQPGTSSGNWQLATGNRQLPTVPARPPRDPFVRILAYSPHMTRRILVVEDDRDIAQLVELHLRDMGAEAVLVHDGAEALELALKTPFDMVILDLMLPRVDGLEITRRLRAKTNYTP